jgi:hypothetical protein
VSIAQSAAYVAPMPDPDDQHNEAGPRSRKRFDGRHAAMRCRSRRILRRTLGAERLEKSLFQFKDPRGFINRRR